MKFQTVLFTLAFSFFSACSSTQETPIVINEHTYHEHVYSNPISFDLEAIKKRGVLRGILISGPTSFFVYKGESMGFEYELLKSFADDLGVELEIIVAKNFEELGEWLNTGKGDIIAHGLIETFERKEIFGFSDYLYLTKQVLVQRKPDNWRKMKLHEIDKNLVHDPIQLINDTVTVRHNSVYLLRLQNLMQEIGGIIHLNTVDENLSNDHLISKVNSKEIKYTIAQNTLAEMHSYHYKDLHVSTPISFSQKASWVLRKNAKKLQSRLNKWIHKMKKHSDYYVIYNKYYKNKRSITNRIESDYYLNTTGNISPYDDLIKKHAEKLPWSWELLASQVFQESRFNPHAKSWAKAHGLMQIMPATARELGITNTADPEQSLYGGTSYLLSLWKRWKHIPDPDDRIKFTLASYNAGFGHVSDAVRLTKLEKGNHNVWNGHVEKSMLKLTHRKHYSKPEIKYGYVHGIEPVKYVEEIYDRYNLYKNISLKDSL